MTLPPALEQFFAHPCCPQCESTRISMSSIANGQKFIRCGKCGFKYPAEGNDVRHNLKVLNKDGNLIKVDGLESRLGMDNAESTKN